MAHLYLTNKWFIMQEIPIKRKSIQKSNGGSVVGAEVTAVDPQPMSTISLMFTYVPVRWTPVVVNSFFRRLKFYLFLFNDCLTMQEIPIKRDSTQGLTRVPLVSAEATLVTLQLMSLIPPVFAHVPMHRMPVVVSLLFVIQWFIYT